MKKIIILPLICLCLAGGVYGQKLSKKESRKILENVWSYVQKSDTADFIKMWIIDKQQWPYHTTPFDVQQIRINFADFRSFFDTALIKNMKFDEVECDTVEHDDPHRGFSAYYIRAWFKFNNDYKKGFGFYMDYVNDKWLIRFSPDYSTVWVGKK
jgi:hypothetical protein